ncbi:hypothetical protein [Sphingopyxis alaskensis]|jgi:hypothetical protein|uniref:hypothetical protein n=1 Tax=Sphingopyxis alaskensis TaxID=117207 RepID=UPI0019B5FAEF|nr:hypothetical protein [Sphingopyxis alaskensis]MBD3744938.1 hypothetical protein [Sphingopyxis terrae]MCM3420204.1 hypothetical protein [Sphingopyxis alaskensis]
MKRRIALIPMLLAAVPASAEPTPVKVHVISQDAKFIGDSMGGVEVVLRDAKTGKILAKGLTAGGTGDTKKIMEAVGRSPMLTTPDAAHYSTTLDISVPTLVKIELRGPLARPLSMQRASSERWLVPGIAAGNGWVVELPGLAIEVDGGSAMAAGRAATLTARVALMCGCPITPGGLWDAADYEVTAELRHKGETAERAPLIFSASPGQFSGAITPGFSGAGELWIVARNRHTGNAGAARVPVRIAKP